MTAKKKKSEKAASFESSTKALEQLIQKLELEDTSLEDSLAAFEEGVSIIRDAQKLLKAAEQKVQELTEGSDGPVVSDFDESDDRD